jgi:hypothetical protein
MMPCTNLRKKIAAALPGQLKLVFYSKIAPWLENLQQ